MRQIKHPYIIKLHEVYETNKNLHLILEYLDGGDLIGNLQAQQVFPETEAIQILRNILEAMEYLHAKKIVHRDLKPDNLILASRDNNCDLRIADFGLASFVSDGEVLF